jgi:3-oxoacyl-[acyl-carrier protein] reductase
VINVEAERPVVLVTGVGRTVGIGAGIARQLARAGWDVAFSYWNAYDARMDWGAEPSAAEVIGGELAAYGAPVAAVEADLADVAGPPAVFDAAEERLGPVSALVMCHAESVDSGLMDTTVERT